jgi:hypothetical protein
MLSPYTLGEGAILADLTEVGLKSEQTAEFASYAKKRMRSRKYRNR